MKIAVVGSHGVGKTTKVFELAKQYKLSNPNDKIGIIQENVNNCPYGINQRTDVLSQYWIISDQIKTEIEYSKKYDITISDRSIFDPICYSMACGLYKESEIFFNFTKHLGKTYNEIILLTDKNNYCFGDGFRDTDLEFRKKVNNNFEKIFYQLYDQDYINTLTIL